MKGGSKDPVITAGTVAKVVAEGFIVRRVAMGSNRVDVDYASADAGDARHGQRPRQIRTQRPAPESEARWRLRRRDQDHRRLLQPPAPAPEENAITDPAAEDIASLKDLTYLNLTNTKVTDAGFAQISTLPKLSRVYIWETAVTPAAVDTVKALCKDDTIYAGLTAKDVPPRIMTPANGSREAKMGRRARRRPAFSFRVPTY
jgi:hypothetical protein